MHSPICIFGSMTEDISRRLRTVREQRYETAQDAAEALGMKYPTYAGHENGSRGITRNAAQRYADFFKVSYEWLLTGRGLIKGKGNDLIPIVGRVGASSDGVIVQSDGQGFLGWVPRPMGASADTVAVEVFGGSMGYLADGSIIIYSVQHGQPLPDMIGVAVVVGLSDGRVLLKRLLRGSEPGLWDLESINGPMLSDQKLDWVSHIDYIVPPWRASQIKVLA